MGRDCRVAPEFQAGVSAVQLPAASMAERAVRGAKGLEEGEAGGAPSGTEAVIAAGERAVPAAAGAGKRRWSGDAAGAGGAANKKGRSRCPHDRIRSRCKECGGSGICQHQRTRSRCKECGGAGMCPHRRRRSEPAADSECSWPSESYSEY